MFVGAHSITHIADLLISDVPANFEYLASSALVFVDGKGLGESSGHGPIRHIGILNRILALKFTPHLVAGDAARFRLLTYKQNCHFSDIENL